MNYLLYIVWKEENNIGVSIIDEQHRGIISAINSMYYFIHNDNNPEAVKSILLLIKQYTIFHFETEESLMKKSGYPDYKEHLELHTKLVNHTNQLVEEYSRTLDPSDVLRFLKEWWLYHIQEEDQKYLPFLHAMFKENEND